MPSFEFEFEAHWHFGIRHPEYSELRITLRTAPFPSGFGCSRSWLVSTRGFVHPEPQVPTPTPRSAARKPACVPPKAPAVFRGDSPTPPLPSRLSFDCRKL